MLWFKLFVLTTCILVVASSSPEVAPVGPQRPCRPCRRCVQYGIQTYRRRVCVAHIIQKYHTNCSFWGWSRCTRYRHVCSVYRYEIATRRICIRWITLPFCPCHRPPFDREPAAPLEV